MHFISKNQIRMTNLISGLYRVSQKKFTPIFKTEKLIYQSKVNLDEKILLGNIPHLIDPEIRQMLVEGMLWNKNSTFHFFP